jgi:hypothetical protein
LRFHFVFFQIEILQLTVVEENIAEAHLPWGALNRMMATKTKPK